MPTCTKNGTWPSRCAFENGVAWYLLSRNWMNGWAVDRFSAINQMAPRIAAGPSTGSRHTSPLLPIEGAVTIARAIEEQCAPPAERIMQRPQHGCTTVAARAHRRAHCAGVLLLVKEQRAAALTRMPVHDWCMHHVLTSVPFTAGTQSQQMIGYYASATAETA